MVAENQRDDRKKKIRNVCSNWSYCYCNNQNKLWNILLNGQKCNKDYYLKIVIFFYRIERKYKDKTLVYFPNIDEN